VLLLLAASLAACSGTSSLYGSNGSPNTGSSGGPPYTVTYMNTTVHTTGSVPVDSTAYAAGATVTVQGNTGNLSWPPFIFVGWNTQDSNANGGGGGGTFYAPNATFTINSNVTLYGQWTP
jgi:hypothetical protein